VPKDDADMVLAESKKRLQIAADYHRDQQLGLAISRLNRLIELNLLEDEGDHGVALRAQVELNQLQQHLPQLVENLLLNQLQLLQRRLHRNHHQMNCHQGKRRLPQSPRRLLTIHYGK
jgi:hypothetical protein